MGNKTHSIRIRQSEPSPTVLYNLIATTRTNGKKMAPFVLRYTFGDGHDVHTYSRQREKRFQGKIATHTLENFMNGTGLALKGDEPSPCTEVEVWDIRPNKPAPNGSNSGSSNGNGGGNTGHADTGTAPSGSNGPRGTSGWSSTTARTSTRGSVEVGEGRFGRPLPPSAPGSANQKGGRTPVRNNDCPEGEMLVPVNMVVENVISKLTGKTKCVYDRLEEENGNLFKKTIGAFIDDPQYHLTFKVGNCVDTDDACTDTTTLGSNGNITITIENVGGTGLDTAALILHEGIHAEIHRYVSRYEAGVDPNNRARLFELYAYYKGWARTKYDGNYNWKGLAQHNYMVENYVEQIASAVRQLDRNRYPLEKYVFRMGWFKKI